MEMHQVRYFLAVARVLNFTRAAEECHVAQPSLTRAIKQLEQELGGELFRRERNLTHLSDLGHRMLPLMQQCYESALSAKTLATSIKTGDVAPLSIALSLAVNIGLLVPFLSELVRVFPGLELQFTRGSGPEVAELLKKGDVDVAIAGSLGETWNRLDAWPLFTEPYQLAVGHKHPLAKRRSVGADELASERLISRVHCEHLQEVGAFLKDHPCGRSPSHKVVSEHDLISLLEANLGVGIAPVSSAKSDKVSLLPVAGLEVDRTVHVFGVAGRQRSTAANTLIKMLRAADWSALEEAPQAINSAKN
ncbi:MAG TPA: LysR family transcriptional regulator [Hyphomicrobiaceae bacterium]|nr:LysR family transcriptional regulator [Hyphomicrobiaceae bacterium]